MNRGRHAAADHVWKSGPVDEGCVGGVGPGISIGWNYSISGGEIKMGKVQDGTQLGRIYVEGIIQASPPPVPEVLA